MSYQKQFTWPEVANFGLLPPPSSLAESLAFNAETLRHYRYTGTQRRPVDAQRGVFNLADYSNFQSCIDAAADYSINSTSGIATIVLDEAIPLETAFATVNVTIPANAQIVFVGREGWNSYIQLNITYVGNVSDLANLTFLNIINYGTITHPGYLAFIVANGGHYGTLTVTSLFHYAFQGYSGGPWNCVHIASIQVVGGYVVQDTGFPWIKSVGGTINSNIDLTGAIIYGIGAPPLFDLTQSSVDHFRVTGCSFADPCALLKFVGNKIFELDVQSNHAPDRSGPGVFDCFIEAQNVRSLVVSGNKWTSGKGFLDVSTWGAGGGSNAWQISNNTMTDVGVVTGTTSLIRITTTGLVVPAVINGNIHKGPGIPHFVDMPAAIAAQTTMIGNRIGFTVALATNMPAIHGGLNV